MPGFRITEKAMDDLRSIARRTEEKWGRNQRNKYLSMLDEGFNTIAQRPDLGVACDYIRPGYRKYRVGRHLIFYLQNTDYVGIIRILHDRMDLPSHLIDP
ncbi:MAG: type II toxin-antitoxin system RelE/ParE family toxin [Desulfobacteraceae bacterium]|nr:type II toxin-antitoxin system RelE/ParE family toxin [Desulfobacteraceae bacterium]